ncbi:hypothetical protein [Rhodococcus sp. 14-2483-1-2]|uniref:hypothetical protein n=1 Tax=Rhodococcus sp. 14-2483-1-2 TaxID=2023147 RepID=UPI000B9ABAEB|nr:hypothetical protein [Rhodococcus sp. 14-2483-1-2]OZF26198.1 hypothetical protein CH295_26685 [Rhodococcus sp. 14-2483-1-2]
MSTSQQLLDLSYPAYQARRSQNGLILSVIIEGGSCDDLSHGVGFAHIREHWALESMKARLGKNLVFSTAKTLHYQTEFILYLDHSITAPIVDIEWVDLTNEFLHHELGKIHDEILLAESDPKNVAIDQLLPRLLLAYGEGTDWGFGDRMVIGRYTADAVSKAVGATWSTPKVHCTASCDIGGQGFETNTSITETQLEDLSISSNRGDVPRGDASAVVSSCYFGWRVTAHSPGCLRDLEDLRHILTRVVLPGLKRDTSAATIMFRAGQFGELYTARNTDYFVIAVDGKSPASIESMRRDVDTVLDATLTLLTSFSDADSSEFLTYIDRIRRIYESRATQHIHQRTVLANRGKALGIPEHPHLQRGARDKVASIALAGRLMRLVAGLISQSPTWVGVAERGHVVH